MTASEMFGVPVKDMPSEVRRRAKAINFGIIYGISAFGLANQLGIRARRPAPTSRSISSASPASATTWTRPRRFCREQGYVDDDFRAQVPLSAHHRVQSVGARLQRARRDQRADSGLGRRHHPPRHGAYGRALASSRLSAQMLLQVHDELVFEVPESEVEQTIAVVRKVMVDAPHPAIRR
jgi:DNA polymerase I